MTFFSSHHDLEERRRTRDGPDVEARTCGSSQSWLSAHIVCIWTSVCNRSRRTSDDISHTVHPEMLPIFYLTFPTGLGKTGCTRRSRGSVRTSEGHFDSTWTVTWREKSSFVHLASFGIAWIAWAPRLSHSGYPASTPVLRFQTPRYVCSLTVFTSQLSAILRMV